MDHGVATRTSQFLDVGVREVVLPENHLEESDIGHELLWNVLREAVDPVLTIQIRDRVGVHVVDLFRRANEWVQWSSETGTDRHLPNRLTPLPL